MNKEKIKRILSISLVIFFGLAASILFFFLIYKKENISAYITQLTAILRPLIIGAIIAYIMKGTCNLYERFFLKKLLKSGKRSEKTAKRVSNVIAVILTYITWIAAISALLYIAIPQIYSSVYDFVNDLLNNSDDYLASVTKWANEFYESNETLKPYINNAVDMVRTWVETELNPSLSKFSETVINMVLRLFTVIKDIAIGLVFSVFFLSGRKVFASKSKLLMYCIFKEKTANAVIDEAKYADRMFGGFLEGKVIDSSLIGFIYYLVLALMGIPYPALIAVICGVTNIIPFFGPFIGAVPSAVIILMSTKNIWQVVYFIIFVCIVQFIDGNIIDPHIVGGNIKMSPFCVIFAVTLFGGLWGFIGLLVGVPTFAVIYDILRKIATNILKKRGKEHLISEYLSDFTFEPRDPKRKRSKFSAIKNAMVKPSENYDDVMLNTDSLSVGSDTDNTDENKSEEKSDK